MSNTSIRLVDPSTWRDLAGRFHDDNYQQCPAYARSLARRHRACVEHVEIRGAGEVIGAATVRVRSLPIAGGGIAYVAGGPLTRRGRGDDLANLTHALGALSAEYVDRRGLLLRVLAPVGSPAWNQQAATAFGAAGLAPTGRSRGYRTLLVDIRRPLDDLRAGCSKYWRRNLRRAEQRAMVIRTGTTPDLFAPIQTLYESLQDRKKFRAPLDAEFYETVQRDLERDEQLVITVVEHDRATVAGLVTSMLGDTAVPLLLAADVTGLRAYAMYLLQWHSIVMARERGLGYYDLGGIDPEANAGVYNFKAGLRGLDLWAPGPFERAPRGIRGGLARGAETIYRRLARRSVAPALQDIAPAATHG